MRIALDYDGTYTADPDLWNRFIADAQDRGHDVFCLTMRRPDEAIEMPVPVIYSSREAKVPFAMRTALKVDVWIEDKPRWLFANG